MPTKGEGLKVAVAGAGRWGRNLIRVCHRLGALKYIVEDLASSRVEMEKQYPEVKVVGGLNEVLADPEVGGALLATPAATHYRLARQVLAAGRHVFVEKPLALSLAEGRELAAQAKAVSRCLMVDHLMQGHAAYRRLRQLVLAGELGDIRHIHSRRLSFGRIRAEEDVWWSFAPHDISMILGLTGREPQAVLVSGDGRNPGLVDMVEARLDFDRGLTARISVGWLNPVKEQRLVVIGDKKSAVLDDILPWADKLKLYDNRVENRGGLPTAVAGPVQAVELSESEPLQAQVEAFLAAMAGGPEPVSNGDEGLKALAVLEAGACSMAKGGAPQRVGEAAAPDYFVHPTAEIDEGASIGPGSRIWHFSHVLGGSRIGENCNIGQNVVIGPRVTIGRGVKIQNNVSVYEGVSLEDEVFCGPSMVFTNVVNPRANIKRKNEYRPTRVGRGASIGANATVVCGHTLGPWCFIGAGAVVTKDVPAYALMIGNPARQSGWVCRCGEKLPPSLVCAACGRCYAGSGNSLKDLSLEGEGGE